MNWWQTLATVLGGAGFTGFLTSLLTGLMQRPKVRADTALALTDAAKRIVDELQEEVSAARQETAAARAETAEARRHVRMLTAEVDACMRTMRAWRAAIFSPAATVDGLRAMVGTESGSNGTT